MQKQRSISLFMGLPLSSVVAASLLLISTLTVASAQQQGLATEASSRLLPPVIPQQMRFAGALPNRAGDTVEAVFRIYSAARGGEPLWTETQRVPVGPDGSYSVVLGAVSPKGLPQSVFAGGQARWLGISVEQAPEQPRALLASVPYSMKAADAEALAGHAVSDFVTQEQFAALSAQTAAAQAQAAEATAATVQASLAQPNTTPSGTGTVNTVPLWTAASTLGNSKITQGTSGIGINQATPAAMLDVNGTATVHGILALPATAAATATAGTSSQPLEISASTFKTPGGAVAQNFVLQAASSGNNTSSPSASLNLLFGSGTTAPAATGLSIAPNGKITFASGQTFPGAGTGTITGITTTSPLAGSGTSGSVALSLNNTALVTAISPAMLTALKPSLITNITTSSPLTGSGTSGTVALGLNTSSLVTTLTPLVVTAVRPSLISGITTTSPLTGSGTSGSIALGLNNTALVSAISAPMLTAIKPSLISGITTSSPLTGSGTSGSVALGLNTSALLTALSPSLITGITTSSPLSGSGTSGSVALSLNTTALTTTLDARYPRLGVGDIFSSYLEAYQTAGPGNAALLGWGSSGSVGTFGSSDTGYGIEGASNSGQGVYGDVSSPAAASIGVLGATGTSYSSVFTDEVGVAQAGVWADAGTPAAGVPVGVFGTADNAYAGAFANNSASSPAVFATNEMGSAAEFDATSGYGVLGTTEGGGDGVQGLSRNASAGHAGVLGVANNTSGTFTSFNLFAGVWGDTGTSGTSASPAWAIGVLGTADDSHAGVFLNNSAHWSTLYVSNGSSGGTGLFKSIMVSSPDGGTCGVGTGGSFSCTGQIKSLVSTGVGGHTVETYAVQSPESWMEDFGSGQLHIGSAVVTIEPALAETVSADAGYHVFLTPNGDSKGLYVTAKSATSFEVRESGGGTASLSFDYRIVAKRRGFEAQRLTDVSETFNAEMRAAAITRGSGRLNQPRAQIESPLRRALNSSGGRRAMHPRRPMVIPPTVKKTSTTRP